MSTLTYDRLMEARGLLARLGAPEPRIFVSHYLPADHVGEHIYPAHPLARWFCRLLGISPWVHLPMYRTDAVMLGGNLYVTPAQYHALRQRRPG